MAPEWEKANLPPLKWRESPNRYSKTSRPEMVKPVRMIVVHTAEGGYEGTVSWLCNKDSQASSHYVLNEDGSEATQIVRLGDRAWTQAAFNPSCISIELAGSLSTRFLKPVSAYKQMAATARLVAWLLHEHKLPVEVVRNDQRFSAKGYTRHGQLTPEGGHPFCLVYKRVNWLLFKSWVRKETKRGAFRKDYGRK